MEIIETLEKHQCILHWCFLYFEKYKVLTIKKTTSTGGHVMIIFLDDVFVRGSMKYVQQLVRCYRCYFLGHSH